MTKGRGKSYLSNNSWAVESFSPRHENSGLDALLIHREREGEAQCQPFGGQIVFLQELMNAAGQEVKQSHSGTQAHCFGYVKELDLLMK